MSTVDAAEVFAFPIAFSAACWHMSLNRQIAGTDEAVSAINITTTNFTIDRHDAINGTPVITFGAIGY